MFRVLGAMSISGPDGVATFTSPRERSMFALLAINANHVVGTDRIVDVVWEENPPSTARDQVYICISNIRRTLRGIGVVGRVRTRSPGYLLTAHRDEVDLHVFEDALAGALDVLRREPASTEAIARLRAVANSWTGSAFVDVSSRNIRSIADQVAQRRLAAAEEYLAAEIALGREHEVLDELTALAAAYPLRSRLQVLYLTALHRLGRRTDALLAYQHIRREMLDTLGVEPDAALRRVYSTIVADEVPPARPVAPVRERVRPPCARLLPPDIADFTGRETEIAFLRDLVVAQQTGRDPFRPVVIRGARGVGKTSLVRHVAHQVGDTFVDGLLYAEFPEPPTAPAVVNDILRRFLTALGVPRADIPAEADERAELYRNLLADRRVLVVLDNAASEHDVYPLMPGSKHAVLLIASRSGLTGLAGSTRFDLDVPDPATAVRMLENVVDDRRVAAEPARALELVEYCGRLPLAIRVVGARLAARSSCTIEEIADRLRPDHVRLAELSFGGHDVRRSVTAGWASLGRPGERLLVLLALARTDAFPSWLPLPLLDDPTAQNSPEVHELTQLGLLELDRHRCRFAPLVRLAAQERFAGHVPAPELTAAVGRITSAWLYLVDEAVRREFGGDRCPSANSAPRWPLPPAHTDPVRASPLSWLASVRADLLAGLASPAEAGLDTHCRELAVRAGVLFAAAGAYDDWQVCVDQAMTALSRSHDRHGEAEVLHARGALAAARHDVSGAHAALLAAHRIFREIGPGHSLALVALRLAEVDALRGDVEAAETGYTGALEVLRSVGDLAGAAEALCAAGRLRLELGRPRAALADAEEALALAGTVRNRRLAVHAEALLGEAHLAAGDAGLAERWLHRALDDAWEVEGREVVSFPLRGIGAVKTRRRHFVAAERAFTQALATARRSDDRVVVGRLLLDMGGLCQLTGDHDRAAAANAQALGVFRDLGATRWSRMAQEQCDRAARERRGVLCPTGTAVADGPACREPIAGPGHPATVEP